MSATLLTNHKDDCDINKTCYIELDECSLPKISNIIKEDIESQDEKKEKERIDLQKKIAIILFVTGFFLVLPWLVNACLFLKCSYRPSRILAILSLVFFIVSILVVITPFLVLIIGIIVHPIPY